MLNKNCFTTRNRNKWNWPLSARLARNSPYKSP